MEFIYVQPVVIFFKAFLVIWWLYYTLTDKEYSRKLLAGTFIVLLWAIMLLTEIFLKNNYILNRSVLFVATFLVAAFYCMAAKREKKLYKLLYCFLEIAFIIICERLALGICKATLSQDAGMLMKQSDNGYVLFSALSSMVLWTALQFTMIITNRYKSKDNGGVLILGLLLLIVFGSVLLYLIDYTSHNTISREMYIAVNILIAGMIGVEIIACYMTVKCVKTIKLLMDYSLKLKYYGAREKHMVNTIKLHKETRAMHHDINNHIIFTLELLKRGEVEEAIKCLSTYDEYMETNSIISSGNFAIDAIINQKVNLARKNHIKTDVKIELPEEVYISELEICSVLGNLLDNAIEASCEIDYSLRNMSVNIYSKIDFICFIVKNNCADTIELRTSKEDKKMHGFGLKNVNLIAQKYDGKMEIHKNKGSFQVNVILKNLPLHKH